MACRQVEITDVELRRRYRLSKANILFILRLIKETTCHSTQRSNPISAELRVNPQKHCFSSNIHCEMSSFFCQNESRSTKWPQWRHGTTQLSCKVRVAHQFKVEHCFTAMLLFLVLPIHISYVYTYRLKFSWKMSFPFGQYFGRCHILRRRKYSVMSDGVEGGGGGRVLHNVIGLKAYTSHFLLSSQ